MAIPADLQRQLVECVRAYRVKQGTPEADGKRFAQLEDEACELGDALSTALMGAWLSEQASPSLVAETACCPRCQRPGKLEPEPEPRLVQTRRGEAAWREPKYYCRHCRQAFFPSVPRAGD